MNELDIISDWLVSHLWVVESSFALVMTVGFCWLWMKICRLIAQRAAKSDTPWDNIIIKSVNAPMMIVIVMFGVLQIGDATIGILNVPNADRFFVYTRKLVTIVTVFWILLRITAGIEDSYRRQSLAWLDNLIDRDRGTAYSIFRVVRAVIFAIAVLTAMDAVGVSISGILTFGGVGGIVLGFAARDTLANFFSGLMIFWERPFVIGDWIRQPGTNIEGVVEQIGWRRTQIRTFDQRPLYIPNSLFFNSVIENPQRMTNRRIYGYFGLRYEDIDRLPTILDDIRRLLNEHSDIDQNQILLVNFDRYGESALEFFIYTMTKTTDWKEYHRVKENIYLSIAAIVKRHGGEFAFPTRTVHLATPIPAGVPSPPAR